MQVTIKTLQQQIFKVTVETSDTVKRLKEIIESEKGKDSFPVEGQKLIYAGKLLEDGKNISEYKIEESKFIVAMVTKPKTSPSAVAAPSPVQTTSSASTPTPPAPLESEKPAAASENQPTTQQSEISSGDTPAAAALTASEAEIDYEQIVTNIISMGFDRDEVVTALNASFNNPERAVEYLTVGLPPSAAVLSAAGLEEPMGESVAPQDVQQGSEGESPLTYIRNNAELRRMATLVQRNPSMLVPYVQQIGQQNPGLLQYINSHQEEFVNFINSIDEPSEEQESEESGRRHYIRVTEAEQADIEHLKSLGFPEAMCIQAYMACEKNLQHAAEFLFTDMDDP